MTASVGDDREPAAAFVGKWHAREPEMRFAEVFCARGARRVFSIWGALVAEWREAALELSDARPTGVKCGWWAEEAVLCAQGGARHPLTVALDKSALPWSKLAHAMAARMEEDAARPVDAEAALAAVRPLAMAIAAMEAALFGGSASDSACRAVAVHLLAERLRIGREAAEGGYLPLSLLARHGITGADLAGSAGEPALCDWAGQLLTAMPVDMQGGSLFRRCRSGLDAGLLRERATGRRRALPPMRALLLAWRNARQAIPR